MENLKNHRQEKLNQIKNKTRKLNKEYLEITKNLYQNNPKYTIETLENHQLKTQRLIENIENNKEKLKQTQTGDITRLIETIMALNHIMDMIILTKFI